MLKRIFSLLIVCCSIWLSPTQVQGQIKGNTPEKKQKNAAKLEEKQEAKQTKAMEKLKKRHMDIQTKKTRKRMKKSARKAKRNRNKGRETFWERIF